MTEADRILKERENESDSDSSMSLDESSGSSDNELSDTDSDSEVSVSDTEENKIGKTKVDIEVSNEAEVLGAVGGIDQEILLPGNDGASAGILEISAKDGMNEYILNENRHSEEDIIAAINEEVNNAYLVEQQQEDIKSKYFRDLSKQIGFDFPHFEMSKAQAMENQFESQSSNDVSAMEVCSPVEHELRKICTDEGAMNPVNNLVLDDNLYPPYFEDGKDDGSGSVQALEKQSENTYEKEDTLVLSDSTGNTSLYTNPSINIPGLNLHEVSNNDIVTEADTQAVCSYDPDMMEKLRLGILKNDSRLSDELGSDHSSDVERGSNHSGEHHVRFKDEVVVMEYSDEEKEEKEELKSDAMEKLKDWLASENENKQNDAVIVKDSAESIENNDNMMLAMGYSDNVVDRSALDLKFEEIGEGEDTSPVGNDENLDTTMECKPVPSFYPIPKNIERKAVDEKERTRQLLEIYDSLNIDSENDKQTDKDTENDNWQLEEAQNYNSASSDSGDSDEKRSDDESGSDSSSDVNVSGEWNLSPLCDTEQNEDAVSGIDAEIPADVNEEESTSSDNICLLNYAPISEDRNTPQKSELVYKEQNEMIANVSGAIEEIKDESGVVHEQVPVNNVSDRNLEYVDLKMETAVHEMKSEATGALDIEEQLKEVELTAKLMSEAVEVPTEALVSNEEKEPEQIDSEEAGIETTFDDEAKDYRTEKNQAIVEEAVTLLDNVEKELEHIIEDIDHTPKLKEGSGSLELDITHYKDENDYDTEIPGEGLKDVITDQFSNVAEHMSKNIIESILSKDTPKLIENLENSSQVADITDDIQLETQDMSVINEDKENTVVESEIKNMTKSIESVDYNDTPKLFERQGNIMLSGKDVKPESQEDTSGLTEDKENTEDEFEIENVTKSIESVEYNDTPKVFETLENISKVSEGENIQLETQKDSSSVTENNANTKVDLEAKSFKILSVGNQAESQPEKDENSKIKPVDISVESLEADTPGRISEVSQEHLGDVCESDHTAMIREGDVRADSGDIVIPSSRITKLIVQGISCNKD